MKNYQTSLKKHIRRFAFLFAAIICSVAVSGQGWVGTGKLSDSYPNPGDKASAVQYYLPSNVKEASVVLTTQQGERVRQSVLTNRGRSSVSINTATLAAGTYYLFTDCRWCSSGYKEAGRSPLVTITRIVLVT